MFFFQLDFRFFFLGGIESVESVDFFLPIGDGRIRLCVSIRDQNLDHTRQLNITK